MNAPTDDATGRGRDIQLLEIVSWVGLTNVGGEGAASLVIKVTRECVREVIVPKWVRTQRWVVFKGSKVYWCTYRPFLRQPEEGGRTL